MAIEQKGYVAIVYFLLVYIFLVTMC